MSIKSVTQKSHGAKMNGRNIVLLVGSTLFLLLGVSSLQPQSFDIGDDPERIEVVSIKQITTDGGYDLINTKWSPDGKYFAVTKESATYIFDEDGKLFKKFQDIEFGNWAPDSKRIICFGMILLNIETGARRKIEGNGFTFLPSGDKIIYPSNEGLSIVDVNTGAIQTILFDKEHNFRNIFYVSEELIFYRKNERKIDLEPYLYKYNSLTKKEYKLRSAKIYDADYILTPSGKVIIKAERDSSTRSYIYVDENGEVVDRLPILFDSAFNSLSPEGYNANGTLVLVEAKEDDGHTIKLADLFIFTLNGKKKKRLTYTNALIEENARWSPKGNKIVFGDWDTEYIYLMTLRMK